jgi:hypothetical protein
MAITDGLYNNAKGDDMVRLRRFAFAQRPGYFVVNSDSAVLDQVLVKKLEWVAPNDSFQGVGGSAAHG